MRPIDDFPVIEVRGFKWPRRPKSIALASLIGEDTFGKWVGIAKGNPWRAMDGSRSGAFETSFVKLFPTNTFWTACFGFGDAAIDVDISLPVKWVNGAAEEIDLELDVLCTADRHLYVRDQEKFDHVRDTLVMPAHISEQAERSSKEVLQQIEQGRCDNMAAMLAQWYPR